MAPPIPDRWLNYKPVGQRILGTRFIAFKVPLKEHVVDSVRKDLQLTCDSLIREVPNLGMIIDLTNTNRYYDPAVFTARGINYNKLMIPGHVVPPTNLVQQFKDMVRDYLRDNANNSKLIGVHCTHGVNRTGYLICNFMTSELGINPQEAITSFELARGHLIERQNYRKDLIGINSPCRTSATTRPITNWRNHDRIPPVSDGYRINWYNSSDNRRHYRGQKSSHSSRNSHDSRRVDETLRTRDRYGRKFHVYTRR